MHSLVIVSSCGGQGLLLGSCDLLADLLLALLEGKLHIPLVLLTIYGNAVSHALVLNSFRILWSVAWVFLDLSMPCRVHVLNISSANTFGNELGEVCLIFCWILFLKHFHVLTNMPTQNTGFVGLGLIIGIGSLLCRWLITREAFRGVRYMESCVSCTLQGSEDICTHRCALKANVQKYFEGPPVTFVLVLDVVLLSIVLLNALEFFIHAILLQQPTSNKKTSGIRSSIVG